MYSHINTSANEIVRMKNYTDRTVAGRCVVGKSNLVGDFE